MSQSRQTYQSGRSLERVVDGSVHQHTTSDLSTQSQPASDQATGGGSHVTTEGNIVKSDDPTTRDNASVGEKLKGDVQGAIKGTVGSVQGAVGATIRNKDMEAKGLEKMQEEDQRLGSKRGVMPVGSDQRNTTTGADTA